MFRVVSGLGDRLLDRLLPTADAAATYWTGWCCKYRFCRTCPYHDPIGQTNCGRFDYC
ncbi:hypothetical protein [Actinoallomurus sp. NPDC050550]|uniref:hypothetical protein n=1 Tax=Actinoallomurus sp. NPDC050550 TaxID=3154937 RepID=UPI0033D25B7E